VTATHDLGLGGLTRAEVECCGSVHTIAMHQGRVRLLDHDDEELARERVLRALGAPPVRCEQVRTAWTSGADHHLPAAWRDLRKRVVDAVETADADGLRDLLDAGVDCVTAGRDGRSVLHVLHRLDTDVIEHVLEASADVEATDRQGRSPLRCAIEHGSATAVDALLDAGASATAIGPSDEQAIVFTAQRVWSRDLAADRAAAMLHILLDHDPGPYTPKDISYRCGMAELPTTLGGETPFGRIPDADDVDSRQNSQVTRVFEVAVKAEDPALVRRLAGAGFAAWADGPTLGPDDERMRALVAEVVAEAAP
jgi:hypothetical protein